MQQAQEAASDGVPHIELLLVISPGADDRPWKAVVKLGRASRTFASPEALLAYLCTVRPPNGLR